MVELGLNYTRRVNLYWLYNVNELILTKELYNALSGAMKLRLTLTVQHGVDFRSMSDVKIGLKLLEIELNNQDLKLQKPKNISNELNYDIPSNVKELSLNTCVESLVKKLETHIFIIDNKIIQPEWLENITIADKKYTIGLGGIHSTEKQTVFIPKDDELIKNCDVTSYYPHLYMNYKFTPQHINQDVFIDIMSRTYVNRVKAKFKEKTIKDKSSDEFLNTNAINNGGKLMLNASGFGATGDKYSKVYSPNTMINITLTGQLLLLILIERLEILGCNVISANTDGIEYIVKKDNEQNVLNNIFKWEMESLMDMEHAKYEALYAKDCNNYVALYDGYVKSKGQYANNGLSKNPEYPIVFEAIREFIRVSTPIEDTIYGCNDLKEFCISKNVTRGAYWNATYKDNELIPKLDNNGNQEYYVIPKSERVKRGMCEELDDKRDLKRPKMERKVINNSMINSIDGKLLGKVIRFFYPVNGGANIIDGYRGNNVG